MGLLTPDERFLMMFGRSKENLAAEGVHVDSCVRLHSRRGIDRVYELYQDKFASRVTLLPFWAPSAWVANGVTRLSDGGMGSIEFDSSTFLLKQSGRVRLECSPAKLQRRPVALWLKLGFRLDAGDQGRWFVQARYSYSVRAMKPAGKAKAVFVQALAEAGVG